MSGSRQVDGLGMVPAMTFDEIGAVLGVSPARAHQIYDRALAKMGRVIGRRNLTELMAALDRRREYAVPSEGGRTNWTVE